MRIIITSFFIVSFLIVGTVSAASKPNDSFYNNQWYLDRIQAGRAWDKISKTPNTIIAVIDSGVQINHPDLKNNIWINEDEIPGDGIDNDGNGFIDDYHGWDFTDNTTDPSPKFLNDWTEPGVTHGTIVAGIIAAEGNNNAGVTGVSWDAQIMPLKALNDRGEGQISDVIRAIDYATNNGAHIINLSFTSLTYSEGLQEAIYRAHASGVMVVAAAGNEQASGEGYNISETPLYPACYDGKLIGENMVIGVVATDALDQKTSFSSYGFNCVDIAAPGISFFNTVTKNSSEGLDNYYDGYFSGTSMATPLVSATLALIQEANPSLDRREIVNILFASTDNISRLNPNYIGQLGNGRLNVNRAVEMAKEKIYSRIERFVIASSDGSQDVKVTAVNGDLVYTLDKDVIPAGADFYAGDVNGDGLDELVVAPAIGDLGEIKIYDNKGELLNSFLWEDDNYYGGVNLSLKDLDSDGTLEIITVPASGAYAPELRVFDYRGSIKKSFLIVDGNWRGGLQVAAGNLDGKKGMEIVVSFSSGSEPQVRIFNEDGRLLGVFLAYEKSFKGGVNLEVANIDGRKDRNKEEILVSPGPGRLPEVKIFTHHAKLKNSFLAYSKNWQEGVNITTSDINKNGILDIVLSAYPGGAPHVRAFNSEGLLMESFYAFSEDFLKGIKVGIIKMNN